MKINFKSCAQVYGTQHTEAGTDVPKKRTCELSMCQPLGCLIHFQRQFGATSPCRVQRNVSLH